MKKKKILVVDDEQDMRIFLSTLLETSGYIPIVAADGWEGIRKARKAKPELIILDVMMPKEGGVEMYRQLKTDNGLKHIPVIILSAIAKKTFFHYQEMLDASQDQSVPKPEAYIEKPPESEELLELTEKLLSDQR